MLKKFFNLYFINFSSTHIFFSLHCGIPGSLKCIVSRGAIEVKEGRALLCVCVLRSVHQFVYRSVAVLFPSYVCEFPMEAQLLFVILWSSSALPMTEDDKRRLYVAPAMRKMRLTTVAAAATQSESYETCHFYALLTLSAVCCPCLHLSVAASVCPPAYHSLCLSISRPFAT